MNKPPTFHAYTKAKKNEFMKSADNPLFRVFVGDARIDFRFVGFGSWIKADEGAPEEVGLIAGAIDSLTSTSANAMSKRDQAILDAGPDGGRTDHVNNFSIERHEIAKVEAWSPSWFRRLVMVHEAIGYVRLTLKSRKRITLRFTHSPSYTTAQAALVAGDLGAAK